ncbi:MAG: radical SAM protein [Candidatus Omnitrophica bacterium]|nr:radical SAM protein [Candidatus Omnitrophota bacterium]
MMKYWDKDMVTSPLLRPLVRKLPLRFNNPQGIFLNKKVVNKYLDSNKLHKRMENIMREWEELLIEPPGSFTHIGFSVTTIHQLGTSLCFAKYLKEKYGVVTTLGGGFFTQKMGSLLDKYFFIDYIIVNEGEISLDKLLEGEPLETIENLLYRKEGKVQVNPLAFVNADDMEPDFSDLPFPLYRQEEVLMVPYQANKGCKNNCSYCVQSQKPLYFKNPKTVADEIERIRDQYGVSYFSFVDNAINMDYDFSIRLCREFIQRKLGIQWTAYFIAEDAPESYFQLLRKAGCIQLRYGVETVSEKLLHTMNRRIDAHAVSQSLRKSSAVGMWNHLFFIMGYPGETWIDVIKALSFIIQHRIFFKSAIISYFDISRIDWLAGSNRHASYQDVLACREVRHLGLLYRQYIDRGYPLKLILFKSSLHVCGITLKDLFIGRKKSFKRHQYPFYYNAFYQKSTSPI